VNSPTGDQRGTTLEAAATLAQRGAGDWFGPGLFAALLALALAAAFPGVLAGFETFGYRDFGTFTYPLAAYHRECFWRGELPLWNPLNNSGLPFLAQWNTLVLYPLSLIYLLLPLPWSLNLFQLAHLLLAGLGMYHLAARWCGDRLGASVAGMTFALNGVTLSALMWTSIIAALAWMPWVLLWTERAWREGGRRVIIAGLAGALQVLTGAPEVVLLTWAILAPVAVAEFVARRSPPRVVAARLGGAVTIIAGLSAVQVLPFLDLVAHSDRTAQFVAAQDQAARWWTMPFWGWANLLVPLFRCQLTPMGTYVHAAESWVASYYCGTAVMVLALLAVVGLRRRRRVLFLVGVGVVAWWLALGPKAGLFHWLRSIFPLVGLMRYPAKFVLAGIFVAPMLAALAVAHLRSAAATEQHKAWRQLAGLSGLLLALIVGIGAWALWRPGFGENWGMTLRSAFQGAGSLVVGVALLRLCCGERAARRGVGGLALLALLALEACTHLPNLAPTLGAQALEPHVVTLAPQPRLGESRALASFEAVRTAHSNPQPSVFQHLALDRLGLMYSCNLLEGIPMVGGFFPLYLREMAVTEALLSEKFPERLADFFGVLQVTAPKTMTTWKARPTALPLVTIGQSPVFESPANALRALAREDFDPRRVVYLPPEARSAVMATNQPAARVAVSRFTAHYIELEVDTPGLALVVLAQAYYHPWRAFVEDRRVALWRANCAFQALEVPAGRHRVVLLYFDGWFYVGAALAVVTLAFCVGLWWRRPRAGSGLPRA
jgi:hypothetical protein